MRVKKFLITAKKLRKRSTDTERYLWRILRDRQIGSFKFRRQHPIGSYVVDFLNLEKKLIVELNGGQHASDPGDKRRDEWLRGEGYRVLRFWDTEVLNNVEGVLEVIREALHPSP